MDKENKFLDELSNLSGKMKESSDRDFLDFLDDLPSAPEPQESIFPYGDQGTSSKYLYSN